MEESREKKVWQVEGLRGVRAMADDYRYLFFCFLELFIISTHSIVE